MAKTNPGPIVTFSKKVDFIRILPVKLEVLPQTRRNAREGIEPLIQSIAEKGLLQFPLGVRFSTLELFKEYVKLFADVFQIPIRRTWSPETIIVIGGHRRVLACRLLQEKGCQACRERKKPCHCFFRRFGSRGIPITVYSDLDPAEALGMQIAENTHRTVPPHEEAESIASLWRLRLRRNPKYSKVQLVRETGRSQGWIRRALMYDALPKEIKRLVEQGKVSYGMAVVVARVWEKRDKITGIDVKFISAWLIEAFLQQKTTAGFMKDVGDWLSTHADGAPQSDIFELLGGGITVKDIISDRRKVLDAKTSLAFGVYSSYLRSVEAALQTGAIAKADSPFSYHAAWKHLGDLADLGASLIPSWMEAKLAGNAKRVSIPKCRRNRTVFQQLALIARWVESQQETKVA